MLFAFALTVRFHDLLQIEHNVDHAYYVGQALRTLDRSEWPIIGQATSLQVPNSAFLGYLYLPLLGLTRSVLSAYVLVIALNSLAVVFIYRLGLATVGLAGAVTAGILYVVNPWVIEYTRSTWSYSIMPFLLCVLAYALWGILTWTGKRQTRAVLIAMVCTTCITLITLTGYFILPALIVACGVFWRRIPWKKLLTVLPIFVVPTLVFAIALIVQWQQTRHQAEGLVAASQTASLRTEPLLHTMRLVSGADYELLRGASAPVQDQALRHRLSYAAQLGVVGLIMAGIAFLGWRSRRLASARIALWLLLILILTPILLMSYNSALIHPFYLMVTLPVGFILAGAGAQLLWGWRTGRVIVGVFLGIAASLMLVNSTRYYQETQALPGAHGLTALSLQALLPLGQVIAALPSDTIIFAGVEGWILQSAAGRAVSVNRVEDNQLRMIVPVSGGLHVTMESESLLPLVAAPLLKKFNLVDGTFIQLESVLPDRWQPIGFQPYVGEQQGQVTLLGYRRTFLEGGDVVLDVYWRVNEIPAYLSDLYSLAVHGFNGDERLLVADGKPISVYQWQMGAILAQRATLTLQPDIAYRLKVGLYEGGVGRSIPVVTPESSDGMIWLPDLIRLEDEP